MLLATVAAPGAKPRTCLARRQGGAVHYNHKMQNIVYESLSTSMPSIFLLICIPEGRGDVAPRKEFPRWKEAQESGAAQSQHQKYDAALAHETSDGHSTRDCPTMDNPSLPEEDVIFEIYTRFYRV